MKHRKPSSPARIWITTLFIALGGFFHATGQIAWVNELHYDNLGGDTGEFIEVFIANSVDTTPGTGDLDEITLSLYNGAGGGIYDTHGLDTFTPGALVPGQGQFFSKAISGIQNGPPDGWALSSSPSLGLTTQFFSYEGTFMATSGPADGLTSSPLLDSSLSPVAETSTSPVGGSIGLTGSGKNLADFSWTTFPTNSAGALNSGQMIVPEPSTYALIFGGIALGVVLLKRKLKKGDV